MAHGYVRTPSEVVNEGDEVEAQVLEVNRRKKQIKLSLKALQEVPVKEEAPAPNYSQYNMDQQPSAPREKPANKRKRRTRNDDNSGDFSELAISSSSEGQEVADPTFMEIALREAMEKAKVKKQQKEKHSKSLSREQEDILSRTLENKVRTS
jgi:predicted RNA-binding protein with RPS1 domain